MGILERERYIERENLWLSCRCRCRARDPCPWLCSKNGRSKWKWKMGMKEQGRALSIARAKQKRGKCLWPIYMRTENPNFSLIFSFFFLVSIFPLFYFWENLWTVGCRIKDDIFIANRWFLWLGEQFKGFIIISCLSLFFPFFIFSCKMHNHLTVALATFTDWLVARAITTLSIFLFNLW